MLKLFKNKRAQNTAEYAILIALVVGGVIAMQTYAQRALQGRLRDASVKMRDDTNGLGNTLQYEPYYSNSSTTTTRNSSKSTTQDGGSEYGTTSKTGNEQTTWNSSTVNSSSSTLPLAPGY